MPPKEPEEDDPIVERVKKEYHFDLINKALAKIGLKSLTFQSSQPSPVPARRTESNDFEHVVHYSSNVKFFEEHDTIQHHENYVFSDYFVCDVTLVFNKVFAIEPFLGNIFVSLYHGTLDAAKEWYHSGYPYLLYSNDLMKPGDTYHPTPSLEPDKLKKRPDRITWSCVIKDAGDLRKLAKRSRYFKEIKWPARLVSFEIRNFELKRLHCPKCAQYLLRVSRFCPHCGHEIYKKPDFVVPSSPIQLPPSLTFNGIPDSLRSRHVYVAGATQHGKSTFIENQALIDMMNNHGLCIIDPKGDLVKSIIHKIPSHRKNHVILLEAKDPIPIDIMGWTTAEEKETLASDIFDTFLAFSSMKDGDQWQSVLTAVIRTLLDAKGCSFLDINRIIVDEEWRKKTLERVTDEGIKDYWRLEFPHLKPNPLAASQPIVTRMKKFTFSEPLPKLLGSPNASLDLFEIMEKEWILLIDLTGVGKGNGRQIGQLIVSKLLQAVFRRENQHRESRVPFYLYCDEFQNFQTSAFDTILSEAGGYKLCLTLANQGLYQLNPEVKDAIFSNVTGAWAVFHIDEKDVNNYRLKALPLDSKQLATLPPFSAFIKIGTEPPAIVPMPPPMPAQPESFAQHIRERTMRDYGPDACKPPQNSHTSEHGSQDQIIAQAGTDTVKARGAQPARPVLRTHDQPARRTETTSKPKPE
jgi:hypothetical protein